MTGSYHAGNDETTWTLPVTDDTVDIIVLSSDFGDLAGTILYGGNVIANGATVTTPEDYSAGEVILGHSFDMEVELSRPYVRNREGQADIRARMLIRRLVTAHPIPVIA